MAPQNLRHQMETWSVQAQSFGIVVQEIEKEWQITMQKTIITGFQQVNEGLSKIEDLMKVTKEGTVDAKQNLNEAVQTLEPSLLGMTPGNINGLESYPVTYAASKIKKHYVNLKEAEILKPENVMVKIWEVKKMDILSDGLKDCSIQKEIERWDVLLPDNVGIT